AARIPPFLLPCDVLLQYSPGTASPGVISPCATPARITLRAWAMSAEVVLLIGRARRTVRSRQGGINRSKQSFWARSLPLLASSIVLRRISSPSPSSSSWSARVALLRLPRGRPLPYEFPG